MNICQAAGKVRKVEGPRRQETESLSGRRPCRAAAAMIPALPKACGAVAVYRSRPLTVPYHRRSRSYGTRDPRRTSRVHPYLSPSPAEANAGFLAVHRGHGGLAAFLALAKGYRMEQCQLFGSTPCSLGMAQQAFALRPGQWGLTAIRESLHENVKLCINHESSGLGSYSFVRQTLSES